MSEECKMRSSIKYLAVLDASDITAGINLKKKLIEFRKPWFITKKKKKIKERKKQQQQKKNNRTCLVV